jgi:hypothetical protein
MITHDLNMVRKKTLAPDNANYSMSGARLVLCSSEPPPYGKTSYKW